MLTRENDIDALAAQGLLRRHRPCMPSHTGSGGCPTQSAGAALGYDVAALSRPQRMTSAPDQIPKTRKDPNEGRPDFTACSVPGTPRPYTPFSYQNSLPRVLMCNTTNTKARPFFPTAQPDGLTGASR